MIQHTPGPWHTDTDGQTLEIYGPKGECIATVRQPQQGNAGTWRGNGETLAAAPELLARLEALVERCKKEGFGVGYDADILAAEKLIIKAKGL